MDVFIECMVKRKKSASDYGKICAIIFGATAIIAVIVLFIIYSAATPLANAITFLFAVFAVVIAAVIFFAYKLICKLSIEYEYAFTNGELDVDAIYSKKSRVNLLTVRVKEFKTCARVFDENYRDSFLKNSKNAKMIDASDGEMNGRTYFADFFYNGELTRLLFSPSKSMAKAMYRYNPKCIHIESDDAN